MTGWRQGLSSRQESELVNVERAHLAWLESVKATEEARLAVDRAVRGARDVGVTWPLIGTKLGLTQQGVWNRYVYQRPSRRKGPDHASH